MNLPMLPIIESERIKHKQNKDEFAAFLGVSKRTVSNWQAGRTEMPLSKLLLLSRSWNCSVDYLLGISENE